MDHFSVTQSWTEELPAPEDNELRGEAVDDELVLLDVVEAAERPVHGSVTEWVGLLRFCTSLNKSVKLTALQSNVSVLAAAGFLAAITFCFCIC